MSEVVTLETRARLAPVTLLHAGQRTCHRGDDQDDVYQMLEGCRWRTAEQLHGSRLLRHLDDEYIFWNSSPEEKEKSTLSGNGCRRRPRTYNGSNSWIQRHKGGNTPVCPYADGQNDPYANYLQIVEDIYIARLSRCTLPRRLRRERYGFID